MHFARRLAARIGRRSRLAAAGACLLLALGSALGAARHPKPAPPRTMPVVVAARALPAGHVLAPRDLRIARWPPGLQPAGTAADPEPLLHETLAGPIAAREAVTRGRLLGPDLTSGLAPGTVAVPVTLGLDAGGLLRAGDRIDLIAIAVGSLDRPGPGGMDAGPPSVVAAGVRVLACSRVSGADGSPVTRLVVATDRAIALRIVGSLGTKTFAAVANHP
jgi:Flp pilus assembly protein CpaB